MYLDYLAQPTVTIPVPTVATVGGAALRSQQVALVRVPKELAGDWRVVMMPILQSNQIVDFTLGVPTKPKARITWGFDGVVKTALVDWPVNGGHFSLWGDSITVECVIPNTWTAAFAGTVVNTGGYIAPGAVAGGMRPTFSVAGVNAGGTVVPGAFSTVITVPNFARSMRWHQQLNTSGGGGAIPIAWFATMDAGLAAPVQTSPTGVYTSSETTWPGPDGLTLMPDAVAIVYQNNAPVPPANVSLALEFVLDLG